MLQHAASRGARDNNVRTGFLIAFTVLLGVAVTSLFSWTQLEFPVIDLLSSPNLTSAGDLPSDWLEESAASVASSPSVSEESPTAVADETVYDFGYLPNSTLDHRHSFIIRNEGTAPLKLLRADVSCGKCTFANLPLEPIPPGGTATVQVRWNINLEQSVFRQYVDVHTNDQEHPILRLFVTGQVVRQFAFEPKEIVFSNVRVGEKAEATAYLLAYFVDDLEVIEYQLSNPSMAAYFDIKLNEVGPDQLPKGVKSAAEFNVMLKPGLPLGVFNLKIRLKSNLKGEAELELPITGNIGGPISIVGSGWSQERGVLSIGHVKQSEGAKRTVTLIVRGKDLVDFSLEPPEFSLESLKVTYGNVNKVSSSQTILIPINIEIAPGSPKVNHMGGPQGKAGEILIPFKNANLPRVKILLHFAVVED